MSTRADNGAGEPAEVDVITSAGPSSLEDARERRVRYATLESEKRALAAEAKRVEKEMAALEEKVLDDFAELGTDKLTAEVEEHELIVDIPAYKFSLSIGHDLWAGPLKTGVGDDGETEKSTDEDWERACDALRELGLTDMLGERFNGQTFSAWLREFRTEHGIGWRDKLPDGVTAALRIADKPRVKLRKA